MVRLASRAPPLAVLALLLARFLPETAAAIITLVPRDDGLDRAISLQQASSSSADATSSGDSSDGSASDGAASTGDATGSATKTASGDATNTATATAEWATTTSGGMSSSTDENDTVILYSDSSITYTCPTKGDEWGEEDLSTSLRAKTATGAGCTMWYTFKGDSVQIYGTTSPDAGVFGCSVDLTDRNITGWWQAQSDGKTLDKPYQGSCIIQGIGYDTHTVQLVNSPSNPGKVYFTGLRYTTNSSQTLWQDLSWTGCCKEYTFPDGAATTVSAAAAATSSSSTSIGGISGTGGIFFIVAVLVLLALGALIVGAMCCRKRPTAANGATPNPLKAALADTSSSGESDDEKKPLRKRHSRRSTTSSSSSSGSEDDKPRHKSKRKSKQH
ncbi:hypothetical protein JCM10207_006767 [Rhodosporidiobolus poonsookiae]